MSLSERERKVLEELERGLLESEPQLAQKMRSPGSASPKRLISGVLLALIGLSILVAAVVLQFALFGVAGFLTMLAGLFLASSNVKVPNAPQSSTMPQAGRSVGDTQNFFGDRWDRRRSQD
jgi:hypothetical protein